MGVEDPTGSHSSGFVPPDLHFPPSSIPLKPIDTRYLLIRSLGHGSFGTVTLAKAQFDLESLSKDCSSSTLMYQDKYLPQNKMTKNQKLVAIKTMVTRLKTLHEYKRVRELKFILRMAPNPHLIQIFEVFIDNTNFQLHIVMEYMGQNLYQMMKHRKNKVFSYPSLKSILAQLLAGIIHIHSYSFYHRDIKPENILITPTSMYYEDANGYPDSYVIKLADFGLARDVYNKKPYTPYVSTRWYRSPEILLRNGYYSTPLDIWAFGCVAFEMVTFQPLFPGSDELDQVWKILEVLGTPYRSPEFSNINSGPCGGFWKDSLLLLNKLNLKLPFSDGIDITTLVSNPRLKDLTEVIEKCIRWDPNKRPSALELAQFKYFHGSIVQKEIYNGTKEISNMQQAMLFAGINPVPFSVNNKNLRIDCKVEGLHSKEILQNPIKKQCISYSPAKVNSYTQSDAMEVSNNNSLNKLLDEKLTVQEFLHEYQRETFVINNNCEFVQEDAPSYQYANVTNESIKNNGAYTQGSLNMVLEDLPESQCEVGFDDDIDIGVDDECDTEGDQIDNELSREIERNLKNCYIPREVPIDDISSPVKSSIYESKFGNKMSQTNKEPGTIDVTIHQDVFKDFSGDFSIGINFPNTHYEQNSQPYFCDDADNNNNSNNNNNKNNNNVRSGRKDTSSYMLSNNIQQEIQPKHNNLLDSSFETSLNFTPRSFLPELQIQESFFNMETNEIEDNLQTLPQRCPKKRADSQYLGNITF